MKNKKVTTNLIRGGFKRTNFSETSEPLFLTSGFVYETAEEAEKSFKEEKNRFMYSRFGNPTVDIFEKRMAKLEGAESCWATSSGMSALFTILMSTLKKGDRVVSGRALFGSCHYILTEILPKFGIEVKLVDGTSIKQWELELKKKTKIVFFETPSNPCLEIVDIKKVSELAHKAGAKVVVDNVFATSILQKPLQLNADIVMYSATKHIDGQGRVLGGAILGNKKFCEEIVKPFIRNTGPSISPFNAWVLLKGLETLDLRVEKQTKNTKEIFQFLERNKHIRKIYYPFDKNSKQFELAKKQMIDGGTVISFELNSKKKDDKKVSFKFLNNLRLIDISNNLGDSKTLITHPYTTTHHRLSESDKKKLKITKNLIRLSVGLEEVGDIINDIDLALKKTFKNDK
jgi:O-succinylhomoserine sulfhydrylase